MKMNSTAYSFTIIVSYKDTEEYLSECVMSILKQSIGFKDNIQLILVDDHSSDRSKEIADLYGSKVPSQVLSIESEGNGVAAAKNTGLKYATGKYINFLDSDDRLEHNALEKIASFINTNEDVPFVSIPMEYFENQVGPHMLNSKFVSSRIIDIDEEPSSIQLSSASSFFRKEVFEKYSFDEKMIFGEDSKLLTNLILEYKKYGVVKNTTYFYRKRVRKNSSMQNTYSKDFYYSTFIDEFLLDLVNRYNVNGKIPLYLQHVIAYSLQWPLRQQEIPTGIDNKTITCFWSKVKMLLPCIEDEILLNLKYISGYQKWYLFCLKNNFDIKNPPIQVGDNIPKVEVHGNVYESLDKLSLNILSYNMTENTFYVVFTFVSKFSEESLKFYMLKDGKKIEIPVSRERKTKVLGTVVKEYVYLKFKCPLNQLSNMHFSIFVEMNGYAQKVRLSMKAQKVITAPLKQKRLTVSMTYNSSNRTFELKKQKRFYDVKAILKNSLMKLKK
ncbi:glycosyltransferase family A protein [Enterococcus gallinarum]|uniref:glycosyltransferase family 2 protein n=1 Tax=Enterococcus gallinarum TaxID=1353 RepID=UPI002891207D|nr:glycosyltransferase family A protein [Enterococcus gallinarum]MDT2696464.1 glycosyltransferase family A protein [Enterococcus gallinarum]